MPGRIRAWGGRRQNVYTRKDRGRGRCKKLRTLSSSESSIRTMMNGLVIQCVKIWVNSGHIRAGPKQHN